jgi:hypothetical protein
LTGLRRILEMKKLKIWFAALALFAIFGTATVSATTGTQDINVRFINVHIDNEVDGFLCADANGNEVIPFIHEGTTFVPIRAIANALYKDASWDASANTVSVTTPQYLSKWKNIKFYTPEGFLERGMPYKTIQVIYRDIKILIDGTELEPKDANGKVVEPFIYNGSVFVPVRAVSEAFGAEVELKRAALLNLFETVNGKEVWVGQEPLSYELEITGVLPTRHDLSDWCKEYVSNKTQNPDNKYAIMQLFPNKPDFGTFTVHGGSEDWREEAYLAVFESVTHPEFDGFEITFVCGDKPEDLVNAKAYMHSEEARTIIQSMLDEVAETFGENAWTIVSISMGDIINTMASGYYYRELWYPTFMNKEPEVIYAGE